MVKRSWDMITEEKRNAVIRELIYSLKNDHDVEMGIIGAEAVLDLVLQSTALDIYKKGVDDSRELLKNRFDDLDLDLSMMLNK